MNRLRPARWPLATQMMLIMLVILCAVVAVGGYLYSSDSQATLEQQYQLRALGIATAVAKTPQIVTDVERGDPDNEIDPLAEQYRRTTGAAYVVIADREGVRYSHPNPKLIGKRLEEGVIALDGETHVGIDNGSLGRSANAIAPIFSPQGRVVGEVSVGILETQLNSQLWLNLRTIGIYTLLIFGLAVGGSILLARRIKRLTFGLEPASIASLLREREALLHGIREGMVGLDVDGRVTVINGEGARLLGISEDVIGRNLDEVLPPGRLLDLLSGRIEGGTDDVVVTDEYLLVVNRMNVAVSGREVGSVITIRDRTEVEGLVRELHAINGLSDALRAQEHEYANHLYVILGLLEMQEYTELAAYVNEVSNTPTAIAHGLKSRIEHPQLAALLLAKVSIAGEHSIELEVTADSRVSQHPDHARTVLTIVGNLVDNAIDAVADSPGPGSIFVHIDDLDGIHIEVTDSGPGVEKSKVEAVLTDGYSTKPSRPGSRRGLGLAIVSRLVFRAGGTIRVFPGPGGRFVVTLPAIDNASTRPPVSPTLERQDA